MDLWSTLDGEAEEVARLTLLETTHEFSLLRDSLSLYEDAVTIAKLGAASDATMAQMALVSQNLSILRAAVGLAAMGFYVQSTGLARSVYENWLAILYLAKFPEEAHRWLDPHFGKRPPSPYVPPGVRTMIGAIGDPACQSTPQSRDLSTQFTQSRQQLHDFYTLLCHFSHTDPVSVLSLIGSDKENSFVGFGVKYDRDDFTASSCALAPLMGIMLQFLSTFVQSQDPWHRRHEDMKGRLLAFIKEYNAENSARTRPGKGKRRQ